MRFCHSFMIRHSSLDIPSLIHSCDSRADHRCGLSLKYLANQAVTRKREYRPTLRWHHKIPHTRISRNGIVIETSIHESDSLPRSIITAGSIRPLNNFKYLAYQKTRFASVARSYSALVRSIQPVDRGNTWIPWRLVCYLAEQLATP